MSEHMTTADTAQKKYKQFHGKTFAFLSHQRMEINTMLRVHLTQPEWPSQGKKTRARENVEGTLKLLVGMGIRTAAMEINVTVFQKH